MGKKTVPEAGVPVVVSRRARKVPRGKIFVAIRVHKGQLFPCVGA